MSSKVFLKKITSFLLVFSLLFMVTACNKTDGSETSGGSKKAGPTTDYSGKVPYKELLERLKEAQTTQPLAAAWLNIPGTNVDYPIVLDSEHDNEYWLNRTLDGEDQPKNSYKEWVDTAIYAESRTHIPAAETDGLTFASSNYVLFGHNWNNIRKEFQIGDDGTDEYTMFAQLPSFTDETFVKNHPYIYLATPEHEMVFKVFSVMYCEPDWSDEIGVNYIDPNLDAFSMETLVHEMKDRSMWNYNDVEVTGTDKIITLSTCTRLYDVGADQRFVIVGRLLREGEDDKDEEVNVLPNLTVKNPNM